MIKVALIGAGRWGQNIRRTLETIEELEVLVLDKGDDISPASAKLRGIQGILIATPGSTHATLAQPFIAAGLPVFIEKPMTTNLKDALKLEREAAKSRSIVFVGHVHLYNPAYLKTKELVRNAGEICHIFCEGMNWGPIHEDMSAWWDWGPHDVALVQDLLESKPAAVQAWGNFEMTVAKLDFPPGIPVFIHVTWHSPEKRKKMTVAGKDYAIVFDDTASKKVAIYNNTQVTHIAYDQTMPLTAELEAFLHVLKTGQQPRTDVHHGVEVVRTLDAVERSMHQNGKRVTL